MKRFNLFLSYFLFILVSCTVKHSDFYVSGTGDDNNPGTKEKPFLTVQKAKRAVHEIISRGGSKKIIVWIGGGTYRLNESLVFGPEDSGSEKCSIFYRAIPGEVAEFSGGIEIREWEKQKDGLWIARLNSIDILNINFRELFIDGNRAIRARHPNNDYLRVATVGSDKRTNFSYNENDFPLPDDPSEVELVLLHDWSISRIILSGIDPGKKVISAKDTIGAEGIDFFTLDHWEKNPRYFLENSRVFLDSDSEWYFDKKDKILYLKLKDGESPVSKKVVVPFISNNLVHFTGTETQKIRNIQFESIKFSYCSWSLPEKGYAGIQACFFDPRGNKTGWNVVPSSVEAVWSENISFINCRFSNLGGSGLWIGTGSVNCLVSGCHFEDISGNGIMIGEGNDRHVDGELWWKKVPGQAATGNKIENSTITLCGRQFFGAVGIWCGLTAKTSIINNLIYDLPYTGISAGWLWNPDPTPCRENYIEGNHIHHIMQTLSDGGGIYMLGLQPGSRIINNNIHDVPLNAGRAESNGMFLDEGTTNVEISGNLIYKIAKSPLRFHKATTNLVKNNTLSCSADNPPVRYNNTPEKNIVLENNQILTEANPDDLKILEKLIRDRSK
jgi:hypothetical protein